MITFLRKIRMGILSEGKFKGYLFYAVGEIVLVVIGILIALQINNYNEARKERSKEILYLKNIKRDFQTNALQIEEFINTRKANIESANIIIEHFEGKPVADWRAFNEHTINIYSWKRFYQNNNTFEELKFSGNLALISNDSIKTMLLNIEELFKQIKAEEDHFRYDSEVLIYEPVYSLMDLNPSLESHAGNDVKLSAGTYGTFFKETKLKNGFLMAKLEFSIMNGQLSKMLQYSKILLKLIDADLKR